MTLKNALLQTWCQVWMCTLVLYWLYRKVSVLIHLALFCSPFTQLNFVSHEVRPSLTEYVIFLIVQYVTTCLWLMSVHGQQSSAPSPVVWEGMWLLYWSQLRVSKSRPLSSHPWKNLRMKTKQMFALSEIKSMCSVPACLQNKWQSIQWH